MESILKNINTFYKNDNSHLLWDMLSANIKKLNENIDKQNEVLGKYYE